MLFIGQTLRLFDQLIFYICLYIYTAGIISVQSFLHRIMLYVYVCVSIVLPSLSIHCHSPSVSCTTNSDIDSELYRLFMHVQGCRTVDTHSPIPSLVEHSYISIYKSFLLYTASRTLNCLWALYFLYIYNSIISLTTRVSQNQN